MNDRKFTRKRKKNKKEGFIGWIIILEEELEDWKKVIDRLIKNKDYKEEWEEL